jgi:hypothetical protein
MKKTQAKPTPQAPLSLDNTMHELAAGLKDTIEATDEAYLKEDPEGAFIDLASRFVLRISATLTVVPTPSLAETARVGRVEAAGRIFAIFTHWMLKHPEGSIATKISASGKFQVVVKTPQETRLFFGETVQDAYAQAAQTICFDEAR